MQFKKIAFFIISATLLFTGCDSKEEKKTEIEKKVVVKEQTKFNLTKTDSQILNLEKIEDGMIFKGLEGKVVLLNFFATWCPPCKAEIPHLNNLKNKYKNEFEVVALAMGEKNGKLTPKEKLDDFINEYKINYVVTNSEENFKIADILGGVQIIPTMYLFDTKGKIVQKYVGIVPEEMMESDIKKALGK